ncbi:MAG: hypothetical protein Q8Q95_00140 [bacterium]|nr:hypothetical protein [bacterium]
MNDRDRISCSDSSQIPNNPEPERHRPKLVAVDHKLVFADDLPEETCDHSHYDERVNGYYCYCGKLMSTLAD